MATVKYRKAPVSIPVLQCGNPKCRHQWLPRVGSPQECPVCKSRKWHKIGMTK
jgi:hypothetical protein